MVIKCPECNHYISDTVSVCPHCGVDLKSEETSSPNNQEDPVPEEEEYDELSEQNSECQDSIEYDFDERRNHKKYIIPIVLCCILVAGVVWGILNNSSSQNNQESLVITVDSVVDIIDPVDEEPVPNISFSIRPVSCSRETDDINTSVSIDFPLTDNESLQETIVSYIINALTDDFTWGDNPRPRYHGDMTDGQAIADFFVNEKVKEISEERARDSIDSMPWDEEISIKRICETERLVSYEVYFGGSHGGVGGGTNYGTTFRKVDGQIIRVIEKPSDSRLKSLLIRYINSNIDSDSKDVLFDDELRKHPFPAKEPFITDKGVRFIYQKYEIGAGALGIVDITIPFSDIADYMSEEALSLIGYE